jgi:predicted acylesterase/phospholipase RssA
LVLSGGANKGAYEAGVIYGLANNLNPSEIAYDVMTGVSAGSLNVGGISLFPVGSEKQMADWIVENWRNMTTAQVFKEWDGGLIDGVLN